MKSSQINIQQPINFKLNISNFNMVREFRFCKAPKFYTLDTKYETLYICGPTYLESKYQQQSNIALINNFPNLSKQTEK